MKIAKIILDKASPQYDRIFDYRVGSYLDVQAGCRVLIPFGRGNSSRLGFVMETYEGDGTGLKEILSVVDAQPIVNDEGIQMIEWLRALTFCSYFDGVRALVPPGIGVRLSTGIMAVRPAPEGVSQLSADAQALYQKLLSKKGFVDAVAITKQLGIEGQAAEAAEKALISTGFAVRGQLVKRKIGDQKAVMARIIDFTPAGKITPKQQEVLEFLGQMGSASVKEIAYYCSVGQSVLETLKKRGILELYEEIVYRPILLEKAADNKEITLNSYQKKAFSQIKGYIDSNAYSTTLFYGVTGSGKTQVFIKLIQEVLQKGKGAIVMVPEIALTPQTVAEFTRRFGERVAVLHSSLSMGERLDMWRKIKDGHCDIVVGTRLSVFAPMQNIGLIVIDEEQESTYHSENAPRYHVRDIAKLRCKYHNAALLLCSATPSIESYYLAKLGTYHLVEMDERYAGGGLPQVITIDMQYAHLAAGSSIISEELAGELVHNLEQKEQSILLLNRRGYNTTVKCSSCFAVVKCPNCSVALTYHSTNQKLICHYCGYIKEDKSICALCGNGLTMQTGIGTQRVEQELAILFPSARILRMDMDTTMSKFSHQRLFDSFSRGEYDIMIGTQMVAKGLNFPKVTLVGVLSADQSLYTEDFRGYEKTFSLITQVVGRSGRAELSGRAYIQTHTPENEIIALASTQDYKRYYATEIVYRKISLYPPYCSLCTVGFVSEQAEAALAGAQAFAAQLAQVACEKYPSLPLRVLGPCEFGVFKAAGKYRYRLIIKCRNNNATRKLLRELLDWYYQKSDRASCYVDMYE